MKFGYRDRIVLLIVVVVVIFLLGIFVFIKPKWESLNDNKTRRSDVAAQWEKKKNEFNLIPRKQEIIQTKYQEGLEESAKFTDEMTSVELGKFIQDKFINIEKFQEDEVEVKDTVKLSEQSTSSLSYYYYTPSIVTYPLYEYADLDGSLKKAAEEKMSKANLLSARGSQTVGSSAASLVLQINREDTMALLDAVNEYAEKNKDTMMIESVSFKNYDFNESYLEGDQQPAQPEQPAEPELNEEGNPIEQEAPQDNNEEKDIPSDVKPGYTNVSIAYRTFYMQEPTKPEVGPAYDETIWDGKEWQDVTAPAAES